MRTPGTLLGYPRWLVLPLGFGVSVAVALGILVLSGIFRGAGTSVAVIVPGPDTPTVTAPSLPPVSPTPTATDRSASPTPSATGPTPRATPGITTTAPRASVNTPTPPRDGDLAVLLTASGDSALRLPAGTFSFSDFTPLEAGFIGAKLPAGGVTGAGSRATVLQMRPGSSTKAGAVPVAKGTTNQLSLLRVSGSPALSGFTLRATAQGHFYNGLRLQGTSGARITDVRVTGVPGDRDVPPGETFAINDSRSSGSVYSRVEVDGRSSGAAGLGANNSRDITVRDSYFHDSRFSHGATFWQTTNVTIENSRSVDNHHVGFNFERVAGTVTLDHLSTSGNTMADLRITTDRASAKYRIIDPVFTGPKLSIMMDEFFGGVPNTQRRGDISVIIDGVDRTADVVEWRTR